MSFLNKLLGLEAEELPEVEIGRGQLPRAEEWLEQVSYE